MRLVMADTNNIISAAIIIRRGGALLTSFNTRAGLRYLLRKYAQTKKTRSKERAFFIDNSVLQITPLF